MKITAVAIGTRGDVQPLAELGQELLARGHSFRLATLEKFRPMVESMGVPYLHLDGDADLLMKLLVTDYKTSTDFVTGCEKLFAATPDILDQMAAAVQGSDVVLHGMLAGFVRHPCELYDIPCVRIFYSPFDATNQYSLYTPKHNSPLVGLTYLSEQPGMNLLTVRLANPWRKAHGLRRWTMLDDYRKQNGQPVLTFYPVSPLLMPPDPKWGVHIHVTGYWYHPEQAAAFVPEQPLADFLAAQAGEKPLFLGFGKAESPELAQLQHMALEAVQELGLRTVFQGDQISNAEKAACDSNIFFAGNVPYGWLFSRVKAVVHHGGCSTVGLGLWAGCPTLVMPLALDQYYFGRAVHEAGLGPAPLYIRKKLCTKQELKAALMQLVSGQFDARAVQMQEKIRQEQGCKMAADILERVF